MLDGKRIGPPNGFVIRKAMGNSAIDFGQFLLLSSGSHNGHVDLDERTGKDNKQAPPATADPKSLVSCASVPNFHNVGLDTRHRMSIPVSIIIVAVLHLRSCLVASDSRRYNCSTISHAFFSSGLHYQDCSANNMGRSPLHWVEWT